MGSLSLIEAKTTAELAELLYDYLPASFSTITWPSIAAQLGLGSFWPGGSKRQSIPIFLKNVLQYRRDKFRDLIITVVQEGMAYRLRKGAPIERQEIEKINALLLKVRFKIPELHDKSFLDALPSADHKHHETPTKLRDRIVSRKDIELLHQQFLGLFQEPNEQKRGYAFETFLNEFFAVHELAPRGSFKMMGEQIDGSFEWRDSTYLVEARWRAAPATTSDLLVLRGKAEKSDWTRGLFISMAGFSDLASETLRIGRKANLIAMSGQDLTLILENHWTFINALRVKLRYTGETGKAYIPLAEAKR